MSCPNGNLFNTVLSPESRRRVFWGVCIPVRLVLLYLMVKHPYEAGSIAKWAAAAFLLLGAPSGNQWWSRTWLSMVSLTILLVPFSQVWLVFSIALAGGVAQALFSNFC